MCLMSRRVYVPFDKMGPLSCVKRMSIFTWVTLKGVRGGRYFDFDAGTALYVMVFFFFFTTASVSATSLILDEPVLKSTLRKRSASVGGELN